MSEKKETTILQKLGGVLLGALALLGALLIIQRLTGRGTIFAGSAQLSGSENDPIAAEQAAKGAGLPAPYTAPELPAPTCQCPQNASAMAGRSDLFPGSYVSFAYTNAGCEPDPRNKRV